VKQHPSKPLKLNKHRQLKRTRMIAPGEFSQVNFNSCDVFYSFEDIMREHARKLPFEKAFQLTPSRPDQTEYFFNFIFLFFFSFSFYSFSLLSLSLYPF
jgi:hypothetical protein